MSKLYNLMNDFHSAILARDGASFAPKVNPNPRISAEAQMNIYVNGYRQRLLEAIASDYPATVALMGQETFDRLARAFIEANPPTHFSLDHYPCPFADHIRHHAGDPFAADLAMLESVVAETFLMEESTPLEAASIGSLTPEDFGNAILAPRTASRLLRLDFPANDYLVQCRKEETAQKPDASPSYLYIVRHENEVKRHVLSQAEYLVLQQLAESVPVGTALENVADAHPELLPDIATNIQSWFGRWTQHGFFKSPPGAS